jgi:hypothetical protein
MTEDRQRRPTTIGKERVVHDDDGRIIGFIGETAPGEGVDRYYVRSVANHTELSWFSTDDEAMAHLNKA